MNSELESCMGHMFHLLVILLHDNYIVTVMNLLHVFAPVHVVLMLS